MLFVIHCIDKPGVEAARAAAIQAHVAYLATKPIKVMMSGPLTSDDGSRVVGSFFIVEAGDRAQVERFQAADPLFLAGIWATIDVRVFDKRVDNRD
ncbi:MAG: YciI family protein [Steroidobacteraceae bacterium]